MATRIIQMKPDIIEQLKICIEIEQAKKDGNPIEWEFSGIEPDDWLKPRHSGPIYWLSQGHEIRLKPWTLGRSVNGFTLADGQEWHRQDGWAKEMLPDGYRPLLLGESYIADDEYYSTFAKRWKKETYPGRNTTTSNDSHRRTTRSLPDKWAKEKAAFAEGKQIQRRGRFDPPTPWFDCPTNFVWIYDGSVEYRIKPEPEMIPLGPEDFPIGCTIKHISWSSGSYAYPDVYANHIRLHEGVYLYKDLRESWLIHRPSKPGVWEKCEKEKV
jgi:hypothetical protein